MINAINTFFDNLFGTHLITISADTYTLFSFDVGLWISVISILLMCISLASAGMWIIHIIFERSVK